MSALESAVNAISRNITREFGGKPVTLQDVQQLLQKKAGDVKATRGLRGGCGTVPSV